jgi:hypothetical protein
MSKENLFNKPFESCYEIDLVPEYFGVGFVRKLNILEEAQTSFAVVQFDVACPLSFKLA